MERIVLKSPITSRIGAVGLAAAIDYVNSVGLDRIARHETALLDYAMRRLGEIEGLTIIGTPKEKGPIVSFTLENAHPHDIATIIDSKGVAVRAGHHCAQVLMERFNVSSTSRASFALYNTRSDVDALVAGLSRAREILA